MPILNGTRAFAAAGSLVGNTVVKITTLFTPEDLQRASRAWVSCSVQPVNYRYDGVDAASGPTGGHLLPVGGATNTDDDYNISGLSWIRAGTDDGAIFVTLEE